MKRALVAIVLGCCACSSQPHGEAEAPPAKRPRASWNAATPRTPPPPDPKLTRPKPRVVLNGPNQQPNQRAGWRGATPNAPGALPNDPGDVTDYDLVFDPDPHCPGWVPVPNHKLPPPESEPTAEGEPGDLPAGHELTLPPPPEPEPPPPPPEVQETLRPTEVGR